jgi:hypothetical protein
MRDRGVGVVELELARTSAKASELYADLGAEGRDAARESLYLDYPFLILYGLLYAGVCLAVAERARRAGRERLRRIGIAAAAGGLAAACADALENVALLVVASNHPEQPWPGLAAAFATIKFLLTFLALGYALAGWVMTRSRSS